MTDELHFEAETNEPLEPLDTGEPGFRLAGLREVSGTFSGPLLDGALLAINQPPGPIELYLYGPDPELPWWKHWFYRIRERVRGTPYPTICLAHGPAIMDFEEPVEDGDDIVYAGTFTKAGVWKFNDREVNS